ncbi:MAG: tRNA (adenosine(37)-N6)-dimethylallyltransferase MiaA [Bacteroidales bacterium]
MKQKDRVKEDNSLIAVVGPTASGKTKYAVKLALDIGGEIISADSRQLYRGMDIGTGKDLADYTIDGVEIPYHLIDIVDPGYRYNIFEYQRDFHSAYREILSRGKKAILCGGSGLYIEAATQGYKLHEVAPDPILRERLERHSNAQLINMLEELQPLHNTTDTNSRKRLIRALEIALHSEGRGESQFPPIATRFIGIKVSREERIARIDYRLEQRLKEGLVEEVESLLKGGVTPQELIYYGLEYKFVTLYLIGEISFEKMKESLAVAIRQFAKRQMTWFRRMERRGVEIEWVEPL